MTGKKKFHSVSRFDEQLARAFSSCEQVTGIRWQRQEPRLYFDRDVERRGQSENVSL